MSDVLTNQTRRRLVVALGSTLSAREIEDLLGGGTVTDSFTIFQTDSGTYPTADSATDTITFTGTGGIAVIGDATTDTVTIDGSAITFTESDPLSLHLDQSSPQTVTGIPVFDSGIKSNDSITIYGINKNIVFDHALNPLSAKITSNVGPYGGTQDLEITGNSTVTLNLRADGSTQGGLVNYYAMPSGDSTSGVHTFYSGSTEIFKVSSTKLFLSNQTTGGFVKTSGGTGEVSIDTSTYLTSETDPVFSAWLIATPPLYSETDTLDTVTGRGNTTTNSAQFGSSYVALLGDDTGTRAGHFTNATQTMDLCTNTAAAYLAESSDVFSVMGDATNVLFLNAGTRTVAAQIQGTTNIINSDAGTINTASLINVKTSGNVSATMSLQCNANGAQNSIEFYDDTAIRGYVGTASSGWGDTEYRNNFYVEGTNNADLFLSTRSASTYVYISPASNATPVNSTVARFGSADIVFYQEIFDPSSAMSLDTITRKLYASDGTTTVADWSLTQLFDVYGTKMVDWTYKTLYEYIGGNATPVVEWGVNKLYEYGAGALMVDWYNGELYNYGVGNKTMDWTSCQLYDGTGSTTKVGDWYEQKFYDITAGSLSLAWTDRKLYGTDGLQEMIRWDELGDHTQVGMNANLDLHGFNLNGVYQGTIHDLFGQDVSGYGIIKGYSEIQDTSSVKSIDPNARKLYDTDGTTATFDWDGLKFPTLTSNGFLVTSGGDGSISVDTSTYLTTETDPVVGAITGIVKANGAGTISAAAAGTDYLAPDATANGTYTVYNDGTTSGQVTGFTVSNGLITAVTVIP